MEPIQIAVLCLSAATVLILAGGLLGLKWLQRRDARRQCHDAPAPCGCGHSHGSEEARR